MEKEALLQSFIGVLQRWREISIAGEFGGLTKGEFFALEVLSSHRTRHPCAKGMYVSLLVEFMHVSGPAVSRMLRLLEEKGYIERNVDTQDRRNTYITMTAEGVQAWQQAQEGMNQFMHGLLDNMGQENMMMLISLWNRFIDAANDMKKKEGLADDSVQSSTGICAYADMCTDEKAMPAKKKES